MRLTCQCQHLKPRSDLDKLSALGRPTLLRLQSAEGEAWAVLLGADAVHVRLSDDDDEYEVSHVGKGDSIHEVLSNDEYEPSVMVERLAVPSLAMTAGWPTGSGLKLELAVVP